MRLDVGGDARDFAVATRRLMESLAPRVGPAEEEGRIPADVIRALAEHGILGMTMPASDGGLGASSEAFALVIEEIAAAWPSLAVAVSVSEGATAAPIVRHGSAAQRACWLPLLRDGSGLGAYSLTEPGSGSDAAALTTTAARDGEGWRLDGTKAFVTNARYAPVAVVFARVGAPRPDRPHAGITAFLVPPSAPGVRVGPAERKMGLHASDTASLSLEGVRLPADAVLGEIDKGFAIALETLDGSRIGIAAQAVGIARGALDRAAAYARERRQFGAPVASFGAIRAAFARAYTDIDAARLLVQRAAWRRDHGMDHKTESAMAKLHASEAAQRATHLAVQALGGYGYIHDYEVERFARDARVTTIYEGTSEIQRLIIARGVQA